MDEIWRPHYVDNDWKWNLVRAAFAHYGFKVSNNEIVRHCNWLVSDRFVGTVRKMIEAEQVAAGLQPVTQRRVTRGNSTYLMNVGKIGKAKRRRRSQRRQDALDERLAEILMSDFGREI